MSTLDFSVADISDNVVEILSSYGDVYCGGSDLDKLVSDWIVSEIKVETGIDVSKDTLAMPRIIEAAEKAKVELSNTTTTEINLPYISSVDNSPVHFTKSLTRAKFEQLIDKEITKVVNCGKEALKRAKIATKDLDGILLVGGSTRIPYLQEKLDKEFGVQLIKTANPDEAVALGAAVQGSILAGEQSTDILLLDVTPLNLGIETLGGVMTTLIEANTTIPAKKSQIFSTAEDNQPAVTINILQGNRPMAKDNKQVGLFNLDGIAPAPRGIPQIEVEFNIDSNGILSVKATDKATGKDQHITVQAKGGLSEEDIERMKKEAEEFAEADKKAKEEADKINGAESSAFQIEKSIEELGDKVTDEEKESLKPIIEELRAAAKDRDIEKIDAAQKSLQEKWFPIMTRIYQASQPDQGEAPNPDEPVKEEPKE